MAGRRLEESQLVARRGDVDAYEELVHAHQGSVRRTAYVLAGDAADAEEAAQDGFVEAYRALWRFRPGAPFKPRLLRIVANEARNRRRAAVSTSTASGRGARARLLRLLHLRGATIELLDRLPQVRPSRPLDLGGRVRLVDAEQLAGSRPLLSSLLGPPDRVAWDGRQLWLPYGHVRQRVAELGGSADPALLRKVAAPAMRIAFARVRGEPAYFLSGAPHVLHPAPTQAVRMERVRLPRDVLLRQRGPLTLRLEGQPTLAQALRLACSCR